MLPMYHTHTPSFLSPLVAQYDLHACVVSGSCALPPGVGVRIVTLSPVAGAFARCNTFAPHCSSLPHVASPVAFCVLGCWLSFQRSWMVCVAWHWASLLAVMRSHVSLYSLLMSDGFAQGQLR